MSVSAIIYLVILLLIFIGGFIFFIIMEFIMHKKDNRKIKEKKTK